MKDPSRKEASGVLNLISPGRRASAHALRHAQGCDVTQGTTRGLIPLLFKLQHNDVLADALNIDEAGSFGYVWVVTHRQ